MNFYYLFLRLNLRYENYKANYNKLGSIDSNCIIIPDNARQALGFCAPDRNGHFWWSNNKR